MSLLAAIAHGRRRTNPKPARRTRAPWAGPDLPVTWIDGTNVLPGGGSTFGDNPTTRSPR